MSLTVRDVVRGRRNYLLDLRSVMAMIDKEQEEVERRIKTVVANPKRIPEPKDFEAISTAYMDILDRLELFSKLLGTGLPSGAYERQYQRKDSKPRKSTGSKRR